MQFDLSKARFSKIVKGEVKYDSTSASFDGVKLISLVRGSVLLKRSEKIQSESRGFQNRVLLVRYLLVADCCLVLRLMPSSPFQKDPFR